MSRLANPFKWAAELIDKGFDVPDALRKASSASSCGAICVPGFTLKAINESIAEAEGVPGTSINFPPGQYDLEDTGITILGDGIVLDSQSPRFVGSELFGVELIYSGTGAAVTFGSAAKAAHYRNGIHNIQIRADDSAETEAGAVGLKLINQHYLNSKELAIKDFLVGTGLLFAAADDGVGFGALNNFDNILTHLCKTGIKAVGISAFTKENLAYFKGGATIHNNAAGSIGCDLDQYTDGFLFEGIDFESAEIGVKCAGSSNRFIGTRSEFNTNEAFQITSTAVRTHIIGHQFAGTALLSKMITDAGQLTYMINENGIYNPPRVQPLVDKTEAFHITKADGTTSIVDVSTSGTPQLAMVNGSDLLVWSDAFSTLVAKITGSTGQVQGVNFRATGAPTAVSAGEVDIGGTTSGTVGAAGTASALPALPTGYIDIYVAGVAQKIPYYN